MDQRLWKKSSSSNGNGGNNCLEVAVVGDQIATRNSRHPAGPVTFYTRAEWVAFLDGVRNDEFNLDVLEATRSC